MFRLNSIEPERYHKLSFIVLTKGLCLRSVGKETKAYSKTTFVLKYNTIEITGKCEANFSVAYGAAAG